MNDVKVHGLKTFFHTREGVVKAVNDINFTIPSGEVVGLVGESGSGKSVTCHSLLQLLPTPPAKVEGGEIIFQGEDLLRGERPENENPPGEIYFHDLSGSHELPQPLYDCNRASS